MKNRLEKERRDIEFGLLMFAISTILWCGVFSFIIGTMDRKYKSDIEQMKTEISILKTQVNETRKD